MRKAFRMSALASLMLLYLIESSNCRPAEEPTRFTLNINQEPKRIADTPLQQGRMLSSESRSKSYALARSVDPPNYGKTYPAKETAKLEYERDQALLEKPKTNPVAGILENILNPRPIVDGITEKEKYGNSGDRFIGIGRALVGGFEGFSNFLNAVVDLPAAALKKTSRGITGALNHVGSRLVGLE